MFKDEFKFLVEEGKNLLSGSLGMRWAFVSAGIGRGFCLDDGVSSNCSRLWTLSFELFRYFADIDLNLLEIGLGDGLKEA